MSSPKPASDGSAARKVSVHLACYNSLSVGNLKGIQVYFLMVPEAKSPRAWFYVGQLSGNCRQGAQTHLQLAVVPLTGLP